MVEKFDNKDAKNSNFISQMEFPKKFSNRAFSQQIFFLKIYNTTCFLKHLQSKTFETLNQKRLLLKND